MNSSAAGRRVTRRSDGRNWPTITRATGGCGSGLEAAAMGEVDDACRSGISRRPCPPRRSGQADLHRPTEASRSCLLWRLPDVSPDDIDDQGQRLLAEQARTGDVEEWPVRYWWPSTRASPARSSSARRRSKPIRSRSTTGSGAAHTGRSSAACRTWPPAIFGCHAGPSGRVHRQEAESRQRTAERDSGGNRRRKRRFHHATRC